MDYYKMRFNWVFATALLVSLFSLSEAQTPLIVGTEICSCAPNAYEFTLDFALTCPPVNITLGDTVAATTCMVSPFSSPEVSDLVPVSVSSIDVLELNQNLQVMVQENIEPMAAFLDGDTFSYISYAAIPGEIVNPEDLPRAIQLNILGFNKNGEEIINVYLITFTNACGAYPVLQEGQFAGWTRFSDLGPPNQELCPAAPAPETPSPTPSPTTMPIVMSMSMSMDMNTRSSALGGDYSIQDYFDDLEESMNVQGTISSEFGRNDKKRNRARSGLGLANQPTRKLRHLKNRRLAPNQPLPISGGSSVDKNDDAADTIDDNDVLSILTGTIVQKHDVECDDYPCTGNKESELPSSSSKDGKAGKSSKGTKTEKKGKSKKSDNETTKKENKESNKDTNKLKKSENSEKSPKQRRLRIV